MIVGDYFDVTLAGSRRKNKARNRDNLCQVLRTIKTLKSILLVFRTATQNLAVLYPISIRDLGVNFALEAKI